MSILLEALRKSEKSQQAREVPSIHAADQSDPVSESIGIGPLTLLLVATLLVSGWLIWHQYQPPAGSVQPPVAPPADTDRVVTTPVGNLQDADDGAAETTSSDMHADTTAGQQRTPVESFQEAKREASQPNPVNGEPSTDNRTVQLVDNSGRAATQKQRASDKPVAVDRSKSRRQELTPILYWELPDAVRAEVPEFRFSVLVYADNPADRFVLINGQRLAEGSSLQPGLVVKEIRRDGVIFSFRLYQFLVEK